MDALPWRFSKRRPEDFKICTPNKNEVTKLAKAQTQHSTALLAPDIMTRWEVPRWMDPQSLMGTGQLTFVLAHLLCESS